MHGIRTRIRARTRSFGFRLALTLAGSMLVAVLGIMVVSADLIADGLMEEGERAQKADAAAMQAAFADAGPGEDPLEGWPRWWKDSRTGRTRSACTWSTGAKP